MTGRDNLLGRHADLPTFLGMLNLKVIWSLSCTIGIAWSIAEGAHGRPLAAWGFLGVFASFHLVWVYWRLRVGRLLSTSSMEGS